MGTSTVQNLIYLYSSPGSYNVSFTVTNPNGQQNTITKTIIVGGSVMVTFTGVVSTQSASGETVTITVTKPGGGTDTVTAVTDSTGAFSVTYNAVIAGSYSAIASIPADVTYAAATSSSVAFTVSLVARTITINVSQ